MQDLTPYHHAMSTSLKSILACPRCGSTPLTTSGESYSCGSCQIVFPSIDGIPWLFSEPNASLGEWRERLNLVLKRLDHDAAGIATELESVAVSDKTRDRLQHLRKANLAHAAQLTKLLTPLNTASSEAEYETYLALRTRLPSRQGLTTYYVNVHRDWAWGEEENEASFDEVAKALGNARSPGRTLILGAGACRLAYDIHQRCYPDLTVALDINPMLLLVARQVMRGETCELYEFPIAPKSARDAAVSRELTAPEPVRAGLEFVLGDALRPPFADSSFDTLITPWLIDIVTEDFAVFCRRINALLPEGGRWINTGSLAFPHQRQSTCYSADEVLDLLVDAGFQTDVVTEATIPYMCSPASRHGRRETVLTWRTIKVGDADRPDRYSALPEWIIRSDQPVPLLQSFQVETMQTRIYALIMSMIDGQRSIKEMAQLLAEQKLMTVEEAEPALRSFLTKMYENSLERPNF